MYRGSGTPISLMPAMGGSLVDDVIQLRLPLKPEYLPVLRSAVGMIAGNMSFTYDEIMQLRVAVSELFDMGVKHVSRQGQVSGPNELNVRFAPRPGELDIEITHPSAYWGHGDTELDLESQALLNSLMDKVEFRAEAGAVRMVKYKSGHGP